MDIEKHITNLKQYIKDDEIIEKDGSDFANFCKGHIDDIQAVLNELEKKDNKIKELEGRCRNLDKEAQSYLEELMGDSTLKNRTIKQLNSKLEKADTVIDLMADKLVEAHEWFYSEFDNYTKEDFKQYFYKKASEE